ncbi:MAG: helical backbone metal receptor [Lentisphaeria bacterium]
MKTAWLALALAWLAAAASAMAAADAAGGPRVVSLAPSLTELVFRLGKGSLLVGRSAHCNQPAAARAVPVVGDFGSPTLERLAVARATLVVATSLKDPAAAESLRGMGIRLLLLPCESFEDYCRAVTQLGEALGCPEAAAAEVARIQAGLDRFARLAAAVPPERRPRVYLEVWGSPLMTVGGRSFLNQMIASAGGRNVAAAVDKDYFTCSAEWVLQAAPEVILCPAMGAGQAADVLARPGWAAVPAVRARRIYGGLDEALLYRLGPRLLEGIAMIRACLYPEAAAPGGAAP